MERKDGAGKVRDGDIMYLKAWSGNYVQRQDNSFHAVSSKTNEEEEFKMRLVRGDGDDDADDDEGEDGHSVARGGKGGRRSDSPGGRAGPDRGRPIKPGSRVVLETSSGEPIVVNDPAEPGVVKVGSEGADLDSRVLVVEMAPRLTTTTLAPTTAPPATTAAPTTTRLPPTTTLLPTTTT